MQNELKACHSLNKLDKAGILCSGACALQCLAMPLLALASPTIAGLFRSEWVHIGLLVFIILIAAFSFYRGAKLHHKTRPLILAVVGINFLVWALIFEAAFGVIIEHLEMTLTIIGSLFLIFAHAFNIKYIGLEKES